MASANLAGRVALVTGGAMRVGRAIARTLAQAGCAVAIQYRTSAGEAAAARDELRAVSGGSVALAGDLAVPENCRRIVRQTIESLGRLDFLIHSAANFFRVPFEETGEEVWDAAMNVNARAGFLLAREAAPLLRSARGRVVLISDLLALHPPRGYLAHAVSKSALEGLVRALAVELAPEVSVNGIAPGAVLFPEGTSSEEMERARRRTLLDRTGSAQDVADIVLFLCSGPGFMTGQLLRLDGGESVR
jgi:pteridine reductase